MRKTCAVIVTYNRLTMLKQCLESLEKQTMPCDILVVNNASTDGTGDYLDRREGVVHLHLEENTGGAGGFNKGVREAVMRGYSYLWLMDDDVIPEEDALEKLLFADQALKGNYGWLSSVPLWMDGQGCRMNKHKVSSSFYDNIGLLRHGLIRASQATFVGLFLRSETVIKAGLPIKEFFIWGDDIEYTRRIAVRMKMPCYIAGQSVVLHAMKDNNGSNIALDGVERLSRYNYALRNENYLYRKEGIKGFCYYFAKCGMRIICSLVQARDHRLKRVGIVLKQFFAGIMFNPKVEYVNRTHVGG
ncbi:MAG: glycosyltransferase family 2 protein [Oscillospiraceae bacterium]|nr:glycosyltransferase family 2 protein [Oscillospiraceae bacterium]